MANKRKKPAPLSQPRPTVVGVRGEVEKLFLEQVQEGRQLLDRPIETPQQLRVAEEDSAKWSTSNAALLLAWFTNDRYAQEYQEEDRSVFSPMNASTSLSNEVAWLRDDVERKIRLLENILKQL